METRRRYIVLREFKDGEGTLKIGDVPKVGRCATWPQSTVNALLSLKMIEPFREPAPRRKEKE